MCYKKQNIKQKKKKKKKKTHFAGASCNEVVCAILAKFTVLENVKKAEYSARFHQEKNYSKKYFYKIKENKSRMCALIFTGSQRKSNFRLLSYAPFVVKLNS